MLALVKYMSLLEHIVSKKLGFFDVLVASQLQLSNTLVVVCMLASLDSPHLAPKLGYLLVVDQNTGIRVVVVEIDELSEEFVALRGFQGFLAVKGALPSCVEVLVHTAVGCIV